MLGTPAFHPKRVTRVVPTACDGSPGFGRTIWPRLTVPRWAVGSAATSPSKNESGIASTRPSPKVGVVRRPTLRTVASAGSRSSGTLQLWLLRPVN